ncbi:MAG: hypothetical protein KKE50_01880 [Nanoarchaeota archaeon]|nr:hypothetical protein [Nanoarchaeota archaeon]
MSKKKGLSGIIATVLLVMLTVAAASMLFVFVVPWIRDMLDSAKSCSNLQETVSIVEGKYTCFNSTATKLMVRVNEGAEGVSGFSVSITSSGSAKKYDIKNGVSFSAISMYNGSTSLSVPDVGGAETYVFNFTAESVDVAPLLDTGKTCKAVNQKLIDCYLA